MKALFATRQISYAIDICLQLAIAPQCSTKREIMLDTRFSTARVGGFVLLLFVMWAASFCPVHAAPMPFNPMSVLPKKAAETPKATPEPMPTKIPALKSDKTVEEYFHEVVDDLDETGDTIESRLDAIIAAINNTGAGVRIALSRVSDQYSGSIFAGLIVAACIFLFAGFFEWIFRRIIRPARQRLESYPSENPFSNYLRAFLLLLLHGAAIAIFFSIALALISWFLPKESMARHLAVLFLPHLYYIRVFVLGLRIILGPNASAARLMPISDKAALYYYRWIAFIFILSPCLSFAKSILKSGGINPNLVDAFDIINVIIPCFIIVFLIWAGKEKGRRAILAMAMNPERDRFTPAFANSWHVLATAYVLGLMLVRIAATIMNVPNMGWTLLLSFCSVPAVITLDRMAWNTLKSALPPPPHEDHDHDYDHDDDKPRFNHHAITIQTGFRLCLAFSLLFLLMRIWGLDFKFGDTFIKAVFSIIGTAVAGFFAWEWIRSAIDKRLAPEPGEEEEEAEEMGAGGSRKTTLLTLFKKFILFCIFSATILIILSAIGINIGPLLAGAGIAGVAIGFGAQTLVKDILSGIFFLLDDSFRIGDYVESGSNRGTVEHISIRSLRLRHPRGKIQVIPYGSLGSITNYSRDWAVMKLDIRVPYNTDLEKVRKIVKKIGKRLGADEELGPKFLSPLKSQGVREIDDSALIMRVKFKTRPGDQFILRREVYKNIQQDFAKNGIEFAPKKVTVQLPEAGSDAPVDKAALAAAALAASEEAGKKGE